VGAAVQLLVTAAHAMGYGSCWMSAPVLAAERLERLLGIEPPAQVAAVVPVGLPGARLRRAKRLPVGDVLRFV
jgi:nitroreductase